VHRAALFGRLLNEKYENIYWSPCAAYCLNLIVQDISKMPHVVDLAQRGSQMTKFLYNHKWLLGWLRKDLNGWKYYILGIQGLPLY